MSQKKGRAAPPARPKPGRLFFVCDQVAGFYLASLAGVYSTWSSDISKARRFISQDNARTIARRFTGAQVQPWRPA